jgi:hypothetical protein
MSREGNDGTCEVTEDTSILVQIEEEKCAIRKVSFVTVLSPVRAVKGKGQGYGDSLTCFRSRDQDTCGKKEETPVHLSCENPTELVCTTSSKLITSLLATGFTFLMHSRP